jgi:hypothetical protein
LADRVVDPVSSTGTMASPGANSAALRPLAVRPRGPVAPAPRPPEDGDWAMASAAAAVTAPPAADKPMNRRRESRDPVSTGSGGWSIP